MIVGFSLFSQPCFRLAAALFVNGLIFGVTTNATAQEAPVIINQETGAQVELIRPYWNANVDIANRRIQCDYFAFMEETGVYELTFSGPTRSPVEFFHNPLSEGSGAALVEDSLNFYRYRGWRVTDGAYSGNAPLGNRDSPFIELVTYNASSNGPQNNAVRHWELNDSGASYFACYDLDGAPLRPSGSAETGNTNLLPLQTFSFQLPREGTPVTEPPEVVRLDTGEPVNFVRAEFDYNEDILGNSLNCRRVEWNEESGSYSESFNAQGSTIIYLFFYAYTGGDTVLAQSSPDDLEPRETRIDILDFMNRETIGASWIEVDEFGYNLWGSSPDQFTRCSVGPLSNPRATSGWAPNRIVLSAQGSCDYSDADLYDGYGWNPAIQESCAPLRTNESQTSVIDQSVACIDADGDGFGWNGAETCIPGGSEQSTTAEQALACIDTDGDGFGWNGVETCIPGGGDQSTVTEQALACIDTDGDGFGWNGAETCIPGGSEQSTTAEQSLACIDTDGDGFGWNGTASCTVN